MEDLKEPRRLFPRESVHSCGKSILTGLAVSVKSLLVVNLNNMMNKARFNRFLLSFRKKRNPIHHCRLVLGLLSTNPASREGNETKEMNLYHGFLAQ